MVVKFVTRASGIGYTVPLAMIGYIMANGYGRLETTEEDFHGITCFQFNSGLYSKKSETDHVIRRHC